MNTWLRSTVVLAMAVAAPFAASRAQNTTNFTIAAGASLPTGSFGDGNDVGYNIAGGIGLAQHGSPLGFRVEGLYSEFNQKDFGGSSHAGGVTANALYDLMPSSARQPMTLYAIGGVGYYSTAEPFFNESESDFGWNLGAGLRFPLSGFSAYIEARYHSVSNVEVKFIPITFGLVF